METPGEKRVKSLSVPYRDHHLAEVRARSFLRTDRRELTGGMSLRQMHQAIFVKLCLFYQDPVNRTTQRPPMRFSFESSRGPSLKNAAGNANVSIRRLH